MVVFFFFCPSSVYKNEILEPDLFLGLFVGLLENLWIFVLTYSVFAKFDCLGTLQFLVPLYIMNDKLVVFSFYVLEQVNEIVFWIEYS